VLAFGLAFFFEYLDSRIKTPDESRRTSGCRRSAWCRRSTPRLEGQGAADSRGVPPGFAEAFRTIRTNVLFSSPTRVARRWSSPAPARRGQDDGGSNLAIGFAQAGSGCCSSTPTCAGRACTTCSAASRSRAVEPDGRQRQGERERAQDAVPGCGCWRRATCRRTRRSCSARSASATS
jgi:hypothetical protein